MLPNENLMFASSNRHKANELESLLKVPLVLPPVFQVEENGTTFLANALLKAEECYKAYHCPVLADDSGLIVKALPYDLGVKTARFGGEGLTQLERNTLLLKKMEGITERKAQFVCCLVLYFGPHNFVVATKNWQGEIAEQPSGLQGFGYDPLFYLPTLNKTVADLKEAEKNQLSHRAKATSFIRLCLLDRN